MTQTLDRAVDAGIPDLTVQAQRCSLNAIEDQESPESDPEEFFDRQVTKDIPAHFAGEWRALAESIRLSILTRNPDVRWDNVTGLTRAKRLLIEAVVQPVKYPDLFTGAYQSTAVAPWINIPQVVLTMAWCNRPVSWVTRSPCPMERGATFWSTWNRENIAGKGGCHRM